MKEEDWETFSIARLELLACVMTANLASYVAEAVSMPEHLVYCLTDSLINLYRIYNSPQRYKQWVGNRIAHIHKKTNKDLWHFCPGKQNPADLGSRGISASALKTSTLWWHGPSWIRKHVDTWPKPPRNLEEAYTPTTDPEMRPYKDVKDLQVVMLVKTSKATWCPVVERSRSWDLLVGKMAWVLKYVCILHHRIQLPIEQRPILKRKAIRSFRFDKISPLSAHEREESERNWIRLAQMHAFPEFKDIRMGQTVPNQSPLHQLNPMWDPTRRLVVMNSRLRASEDLSHAIKFPIILPRQEGKEEKTLASLIVEKLVFHIHTTNLHSGLSSTMSFLRRRFHLMGGRNELREFFRHCKKCLSPVPLQQQMAPLPKERIDSPDSFRYVGCDFFGPLFSTNYDQQEKNYVALFTCFHSRAVHLELVHDLTTSNFLQAFSVMCITRGLPEMIFTDCAKTFKGANAELKRLYRKVDWNKVVDHAAKKNIKWEFNTEKAPWANGICEHLVQTVKRPMRKLLGSAKLTFTELNVLLKEVEAVVNNRPLSSRIGTEPEELHPITPAELCIGRRLDMIPDGPPIAEAVNDFQCHWCRRRNLLNGYWRHWRQDYLLNLQPRQKWIDRHPDVKIDQVVLVHDDNMSRGDWRIARVKDVHVNPNDNLIRSVTLQTAKGVIKRPIQRLSLLETDVY